MQPEGLNTAQASSKNGSKSLTRNLSHTMRTEFRSNFGVFMNFRTEKSHGAGNCDMLWRLLVRMMADGWWWTSTGFVQEKCPPPTCWLQECNMRSVLGEPVKIQQCACKCWPKCLPISLSTLGFRLVCKVCNALKSTGGLSTLFRMILCRLSLTLMPCSITCRSDACQVLKIRRMIPVLQSLHDEIRRWSFVQDP